MAIDVYNFPQADSGTDSESDLAVREVSFADGYNQVGSNGINGIENTHTINFTGRISVAQTVRDFATSHMTKAFVIRPNGFPKGLYRVVHGTVKYKPMGPIYASVTFQIKTANGIYS